MIKGFTAGVVLFRCPLLELNPMCSNCCVPPHSDTPLASEGGAKTARSKASSRFPRLGRGRNQETRNPEPQSGDL